MKKQIHRDTRVFVKTFLCSLILLSILFSTTACFVPKDDEHYGISLFVDGDKAWKVLQFSDLHFGVEGSAYHNTDVARTLEFVDYAIKSQQPDLIVLLGDNMMTQGVEGARFIVETFDKYETPYIFVFGNHDAELYDESLAKSDVSEYLDSCDSKYLLYKTGYVDTEENRYGNFSVSVRDENSGELLGAFVILDTGVYDYGKEMYQSINEGQIAWYEQEIERLNGLYALQSNNALFTMPSITYGHMQLPEYVDAYKKAKSGDGAEFVYYQDISERRIDGLLGNTGEINYGFFDAMKRLQSSKAYLCGHMHGLNYHVKMDGIVLGFCPQAGVLGNKTNPITTFSYTVDRNFEISLELVVEPIE